MDRKRLKPKGNAITVRRLGISQRIAGRQEEVARGKDQSRRRSPIPKEKERR